MKVLKKALPLFAAVLLIFDAVSVNAADTAKKFDEETFFIYTGTYGEEHYPLFEYCYPSNNISGTNYLHRKVFYKGELDVEPVYGDLFLTHADVVTKKDAATLSTYELAADTLLLRAGNCSYLLDKKELTVKSNTYDGNPLEPHFRCFTLHLDDGTGRDMYYSEDYFASDTLMLDDAKTGDKVLFSVYKDSAILPLEKPVQSTADPETPKAEQTAAFTTIIPLFEKIYDFIIKV